MTAAMRSQTSIRSSAIRRLGETLQTPWPSETAAQMHAIDRELVRRRQLERLVPADAVAAVLRRGMLPTSGDRRILTIMFVDIRGSARIEETLSPERTIEFLNTYLGIAARAIMAHKGSVNKFIGDGILAVFGVLDQPDHGALDAVSAAVDIHQAFEAAGDQFISANPVRAVVAMHTGLAIIGVVGLAERSDYAVLGSAVNVASRLESEGKELGLRTILSGSTVIALPQRPACLHLVTRKSLRGMSTDVEIWTLDPDPVHHAEVSASAQPSAASLNSPLNG
jgi:adenylate cyclase